MGTYRVAQICLNGHMINDESIDTSTKMIIHDAIPNLITETPSTPVSVEKYKISVETVSQYVKDGLHNLLVDVVSESVKKLLFP